ncbi:MAG: TRL-like family protein [Bdellovibrionia bacterium]
MKSSLTLLALTTALFSGCATTGLYTKTGVALVGSFKEPVMATTAKASKSGRACTDNILGVSFGDASIEAAKKNGGISTVSTVDSEIKNILGIYGQNCTIVTGE